MERCDGCGRIEKPLFKLENTGFIKYYEKKVKNTVLKYGMLEDARRLALAVSDGKGSPALARAFLEVFPKIKFTIIHLNLGIPNYSDECQEVVERFCSENSIQLLIYGLSNCNGYSIYDFVNTAFSKRICGACGVVKRYPMNKIALENGFDALATFHNLDDTVKILFNLYINGKIDELVRIKPLISSGNPKIVRKIKPLIEITDGEDLHYLISREIEFANSECPLAKGSRMVRGKKLIVKIEDGVPNFKYLLLKVHLKRFLPLLEECASQPSLRECEKCDMPSVDSICSFLNIFEDHTVG